MDNGARAYRDYLAGNDNALIELVGEYKMGITLYLNGIVGDIFIAKELMEAFTWERKLSSE